MASFIVGFFAFIWLLFTILHFAFFYTRSEALRLRECLGTLRRSRGSVVDAVKVMVFVLLNSHILFPIRTIVMCLVLLLFAVIIR